MLYYLIDGSLNPCWKLRFMYKVSNAKLSEPDCAAWLCRKLVASDALRRKNVEVSFYRGPRGHCIHTEYSKYVKVMRIHMYVYVS